MPYAPLLKWITWIGPSSRLAAVYGHAGGRMHRGAGVLFVGKLMIIAVVVIVLFVFGAMAAPGISAWAKKRYNLPDYSHSAAMGVFHIVAFVLAIALLAALARFL